MTFDEIFQRAFVPMQQVFGHALEADVLTIYRKHLGKKLTPQEFAKACVHVLDNFKPTAACRFPTPAHFIDYALGTAEDRAAKAVARIVEACRRVGPNRSISFGDRALHRTIERFGGWEEMRDFDWQFRETNFKKAYIAELGAGDAHGPEYLPGCYEKTNDLTRHNWDHGQEKPFLIVHFGQAGEPVKELPPVEKPQTNGTLNPIDAVRQISSQWDMGKPKAGKP